MRQCREETNSCQLSWKIHRRNHLKTNSNVFQMSLCIWYFVTQAWSSIVFRFSAECSVWWDKCQSVIFKEAIFIWDYLKISLSRSVWRFSFWKCYALRKNLWRNRIIKNKRGITQPAYKEKRSFQFRFKLFTIATYDSSNCTVQLHLWPQTNWENKSSESDFIFQEDQRNVSVVLAASVTPLFVNHNPFWITNLRSSLVS